MGSQTTPLLTQFPITILHDFGKCQRRVCSAIRSRRDWERDVRQSPANQRFRFNDGSDDEDGFGFRNASNQRIWWYDGVDDDVYDDAGEYDVDEGFDIREASLGINMFVKIFQAFGWMIPAIAASLLMGTGHDSTVMALALPLAQTALSLLYDAIWARQVDSSWPKSKKKKKNKKTPSARTRNRRRVRKENEMYDQSENNVGDYKSWVDSDNVSGENKNKKFGGWDELVNELSVYKGSNAAKLRPERERSTQERVKSDSRKKGDTHLFIRLMIDLFPFLGFLTRLW